jgi:hypothetical protein
MCNAANETLFNGEYQNYEMQNRQRCVLEKFNNLLPTVKHTTPYLKYGLLKKLDADFKIAYFKT